MKKYFTATQISQLRYNAERKAQDQFAKRNVSREGLLEAIYRHYTQEIESKINTFYMNYAKAEGITLKEARARAEAMDVAAFGNRAKQAVLDRDFRRETNEWLKVYNLKMQVSREELLKYEVQLELYGLIKESESVMLSGMTEEYRQELKRQAGILGNSVPKMGDRVEALINADFYGAKFSERIWGKNGKYDSLNRQIMKSIGNIVGQKSDYKKEVKRMREQFEVSEGDAYRLIRTETRRMNAMAQLDSFKANEFTHYVYVAEAGACLTCASLDQTVIPIGEAQDGYNYPTMHPNCRCSTYGIIKLTYVDTGDSNISMHEDEYGSYEDALKDLADVASGKVKTHEDLRNKSKDYLDLSYFGYSKDRAR